MGRKEKQKRRERKPAHRVFLEMAKELMEYMDINCNMVYQLQKGYDKLCVLLEVIDRSIIPENELAEFVVELQKLVDFHPNISSFPVIGFTIDRLKK